MWARRRSGFMVENRHLRMAVGDRVRETPGITIMAPAALAGIEADDTGAALTFESGPAVRARLVIGADGRGSFVREAAGIELTCWQYGQTGIVCTVAHQHPHHNAAHEHFFPAGPFAILPLTRNRVSIVWTERTAVAEQILALPEEPFLEELSERLGDFLGQLEVVGPRWSYPLALQYAEDHHRSPHGARRGRRPGHASHRRPGPQPGAPGRGGAGRSDHRRGASGSRYRRGGDPRPLSTVAAVRQPFDAGPHRRAQPAVFQRPRRACAARGMRASRWSTGPGPSRPTSCATPWAKRETCPACSRAKRCRVRPRSSLPGAG